MLSRTRRKLFGVHFTASTPQSAVIRGETEEERGGRRLTLTQLHQSRDDDEDESGHFGIGEDILHAGPPFHLGGVNEGQ